jgi:PHS family inorganic phosphate transporter-like MFS transporter
MQQRGENCYGSMMVPPAPDNNPMYNVVGAEYLTPLHQSSSTRSSTTSSPSESLSLAPTEDSSSTTCQQEPKETTDPGPPIMKRVGRNSTTADTRLAMASNFSAAYNTFNISLALALMKQSHPPSHAASDIASCTSAVIGGMIVGQLIGGYLGDWLGRHMAMAVVMCIQVGSALMSAFSGKTFLYFLMKTTTYHGEEEEETSSLSLVYMELAIWRFLLGFGCGGVYPLSATITAESSSDKNGRPRLLAKMFSMQGVGYLAVPVVAFALVGLFGNDDDGSSSSSDMAWRLLLGTGSLPGFALIITRLYRRKRESLTQQHPQKKRKQRNVRLQPTSMLQQIHHEHKLRSKLIGTAGTWLLFDVLFYGNALFQPKVLRSAFGPSETELYLIRDTILIGLLGLPGKNNDEIGSLYIFLV